VVSLPQETFFSSGASVKASILFMQKFSVEEQEKFNKLQAQTRAEIKAKYAPEIEAESKRLTAEIENLKAEKTKEASEKRKAAQKELNTYLKATEEKVTAESRALLKECFDYPVFMYQAESVGITATGEPDKNELFPNDNKPNDIEKTCLELFQKFKMNPSAFEETQL
jgi:type I restriction enzyme M protein